MESNNKRIAKNTLFLYFRMIVIMGVQLYTVRVVLGILGASDYGLYNVVGGIVSMLAFLSSMLSTASQRYFAFEIGKGDAEQLRKTFSMTLLIYCLVGMVILLLLETIGLYFLNSTITMPADRIHAANWVYQFAIISLFLTMFQTPYSAMVVAYERMNFFAYIGILEVGLKLVVVYLLMIGYYDKLVLYGILNLAVTFLVTTINKVYCLRNFKESRFQYYWNKSLFKEIMSYSGWNLFGALAGIMNNQGVNILLNIFFGPIVNAARAIAFQVNTSINQFVQNFLTATRPQITKYYAQGEMINMIDLMISVSKYSFFLLFLISIPLLTFTKEVFDLWLSSSYPKYTILFTRIILITALIDSLSYPLMTVFQATGKVKKYQVVIGGLTLLSIPISYVLFKFTSADPSLCLWIVLGISLFCLFMRLNLLDKLINIDVSKLFMNKVILKITPISLIIYLSCYIIDKYNVGTISYVFLTLIILVILYFILLFTIGLTRKERFFIKNILNKRKFR